MALHYELELVLALCGRHTVPSHMTSALIPGASATAGLNAAPALSTTTSVPVDPVLKNRYHNPTCSAVAAGNLTFLFPALDARNKTDGIESVMTNVEGRVCLIALYRFFSAIRLSESSAPA
jgi:hypothetical protein